ncbi:hypothetical protein [Jeotgalibacillus salarius]|uniref:Uncharacterized protein n=1 Tax=Jeotgalibacillus salarius TaxID=546023 RepID=A0A4Y8LPV8_9BACL|nr:hypothetical protein [Jeotgalibacillus salarius]TFE04041.1 hypothetical protein E2626_01555 [Jeotgalibacillus salarius]
MNSITLEKWSDVVLPIPARYRAVITRDHKILFHETDMTPFINQDQRTFREDFMMYQFDGDNIISIVIKDMPFPPTHFDTFTDGTLLLASARCVRTDDWIQKNAGRYSLDGECLYKFVLGDGISAVAIDDEDTIWAGYYEEGVYGNYGWDEPIGSSGLVAFSSKGEVLFRPHLPMINELYYLNIQKANSIFAYYSLFSAIIHLDHFGRVQHSEIEEVMEVGPITIINESLITYDYHSKLLWSLKKQEGVYKKDKAFALKDQEGNDLYSEESAIRIRGNWLFVLNDSGIYRVELTMRMLEE